MPTNWSREIKRERSPRKTPGELLLPQIAALFGTVLEDPSLPAETEEAIGPRLADPYESLTILFQSLQHLESATMALNEPRIEEVTRLRQRVMPVINTVVERYIAATGKKAREIDVKELEPLLVAADPEIGTYLHELHAVVSELVLANWRLISTAIRKLQEVSPVEHLELYLSGFEYFMMKLYYLDANIGKSLSTYMVASLWSGLDTVRHLNNEEYPLDFTDTRNYRRFQRSRDYLDQKSFGGQLASDWGVAAVLRFRWEEDGYDKLHTFWDKLPEFYREALSLEQMMNVEAWLRYWRRHKAEDEFFEPELSGQDLTKLKIESRKLELQFDRQQEQYLALVKLRYEEARQARIQARKQEPEVPVEPEKPETLADRRAKRRFGITDAFQRLLHIKAELEDQTVSSAPIESKPAEPEEEEEVQPDVEPKIESEAILGFRMGKLSELQLSAFQQMQKHELKYITKSMVTTAVEMLEERKVVHQAWLTAELERTEISAGLIKLALSRPYLTKVHRAISDAALDFQNLNRFKKGLYFGMPKNMVDEDGVPFELTYEDWVDTHLPDPEQPDPAEIPVVSLRDVFKIGFEAADLSEDQVKVLTLRYGLSEEGAIPLTHKQIANEMGLTEERVSAIDGRAMIKLYRRAYQVWHFWSMLLHEQLDYLNRLP
jgi:hypothetical protein